MALKGEVKVEDGVFSCGEYDLMPSRVKTCYYEKISLQEERQSCLDPIPTCSKTCGKPFPCGMHHCIELCHAGDCPPCLLQVSQKCRCGSNFRTVECYKTTVEEKFTCDKPCGQKKNCGRHRCSERCCRARQPKMVLSRAHPCAQGARDSQKPASVLLCFLFSIFSEIVLCSLLFAFGGFQ